MHQRHPQKPQRARPVQTKPLTLDSARVDELYGLEPVFDPAHPLSRLSGLPRHPRRPGLPGLPGLPRGAQPKTAHEGDASSPGRVSGVHPAGTAASLEAESEYDQEAGEQTEADADTYDADADTYAESESDSDTEMAAESMDGALGAFVEIQCPACWEMQSVDVDLSAGPRAYIEDCQVCCHPLELTLVMDSAGEFTGVTVSRTE